MSRIACCLLALVLVTARGARGESPDESPTARAISRPGPAARSLGPATGGGGGLVSNVWPLLTVLALIGGAAWLLKRNGWTATSAAANGSIQVLARIPLDARCAMLVVRCGERLLVLGVSPAGVSTLSEIQHLEEVQSLVENCAVAAPAALTDRLAQLWIRPMSRGEAA
jgi:flagellar protein FliO/FliZ